MTDKLTEARAQIASAEAALRRARARLEEAEREAAKKTYPPAPESDYIAFTIQFSNLGTYYRYAAVRANGHWYTTGGDRFDSWEKLVDWIRAHNVGGPHIKAVRELVGSPSGGIQL